MPVPDHTVKRVQPIGLPFPWRGKKDGSYGWLKECYRNELPDWEEEKIEQLTEETLSCIKENDDNLAAAEEAAAGGLTTQSKEFNP